MLQASSAHLLEQRDLILQEQRTAQRLCDQLRLMRGSVEPELESACAEMLRDAEKLQEYFQRLGPLVEQMELELGIISRNIGAQLEDNIVAMRRFQR